MPLAPLTLALRRLTLAAPLLALMACSGVPSRPEATSVDASTKTEDGVALRTDAQPVLTEQQALARIKDENSIYFAFGATQVDAAGEAKLRAHAEHLKANPKLDVVLTGHTDDRGSRSYNLAVSDQRTLAVARLLQSSGIARSRIKRVSLGREKPGVVCKSTACQRKLRRVDISYRE
jgi:outer membrane protein OmpA-like peptidoglycan-associated protein